MSVNSKKILSIIVYYTLAALALATAGFFIYTLVLRTLPMWAEVIYYIWIACVIGVVIYDIYCTSSRKGKQISGLIIYVLSVLSVIVSIILYFVTAGMNGLDMTIFPVFLSVALISLMATGFMIATWCVGESLVEHKVAEDKIRERE